MWGGGNQWGQWPMDAAAYQNISHEQVDWATLAQQWIRMKEVHETAIVRFPVPVVQVAPIVHHVMAPQQPNVGYFTSEIHQEKGEAPMEVDKEEPEPAAESFSGPPAQWNQNTWTPPAANFAFPPAYPHPGYYTGPPRPPVMMQNAKVPPVPGAEEGSSLAAFAQGLDAAKRKQLPAWIREGLEKMERDKQKKEEREKMLEERELKRQQSLKTSEDDGPYTSLTKSRFDDSESENEAVDEDEPSATETSENLPDPQPQPVIRSPEEILHDAMMRIRRLMTEILLDVTSEEIQSIANEEYQRAVVKNRTRQSTTLGSKSLPKNLGLDYGSDSDVDEDSDETENRENLKKMDREEDSDSDERLEETIAEKKRLFAMGQFDRDRRARIAEQEFHRWEKRLQGIVESSESEESEEEDDKVSNVVTTKVEVETGNVKIDPGSLAGKAAENESGAKEKGEKPIDEPRRSRSTETASSKSKSDEKKRVGKDTKSRRSESSSEKRRSRSRDRVRRRSRSRTKDRPRRRSRSRSRDRVRRRSRSRSRDRERRRDSGRKRSRSRDSRRSRSKSRDRRKKRSRSRSRDGNRAKRSRSRERRHRRSSS